MQVAIDRQASGLKPHLSLVSLFEALLDPIAFSGSLLAVAACTGWPAIRPMWCWR
jgi:hypothetical protein